MYYFIDKNEKKQLVENFKPVAFLIIFQFQKFLQKL